MGGDRPLVMAVGGRAKETTIFGRKSPHVLQSNEKLVNLMAGDDIKHPNDIVLYKQNAVRNGRSLLLILCLVPVVYVNAHHHPPHRKQEKKANCTKMVYIASERNGRANRHHRR